MAFKREIEMEIWSDFGPSYIYVYIFICMYVWNDSVVIDE